MPQPVDRLEGASRFVIFIGSHTGGDEHDVDPRLVRQALDAGSMARASESGEALYRFVNAPAVD